MTAQIEIQSVMTPCPHSIGLDQSVKVARDLMKKHNFRHLPVQNGGRLVGIISDRDIKFASGWAKDDSQDFIVSDIYIPEPYVVEPTTPLVEAVQRMANDQIGCVLVAVHKDKLVGIFTTTDACKVLAQKLA